MGKETRLPEERLHMRVFYVNTTNTSTRNKSHIFLSLFSTSAKTSGSQENCTCKFCNEMQPLNK